MQLQQEHQKSQFQEQLQAYQTQYQQITARLARVEQAGLQLCKKLGDNIRQYEQEILAASAHSLI